ncbi:MAG TPA: hypothetical protein VE338_17320 [Ktedonobacterales bacterium]|nr:hypothetical protein [Ktedonobacterales bacterium]
MACGRLATSGSVVQRANSEREMYPDYPRYSAPVYPPPPRPVVRRRPNVALRLAVSLLAMLLTLSVALATLGLVADPQLVVALLPVTATRVTGTIYGEDLAQLNTGQTARRPLAGATIACGGVRASANAQGRYTLSLLRGRAYSCAISAPLYSTVYVALAPRFLSAFQLDIGPAFVTSSSGGGSSSDGSGAASSAQAGVGCVVAASREVCPAMALTGGALSGQVTDSHSYTPIAHAPVFCWDDSLAAQVSPHLPARYSGDTDAQGRYSLRDMPPGAYLCVANQQGAPQRVVVAPAAATTANFVECGARCTGMTYHSGPVMHTFTAYVIFWAPPGASFEPSGSNGRFQSLVRQYLTDVGGTRFYGLLTQYWDQQGPVRNVETLGGTYLDQRAYPHAGTRADPLSDSDVTAEITRVRELKGWKVTPDAAFIVLTGYNVQECAKFSNGQACSFPDNSGNGFCAYHSFMPYYGGNDGPNYLPYLYIANNTNCVYLPTFDSSGVPYGDRNADAVINSLSHEQFETVTDPQTRGWYDGDPSGGEIGDKCETTFGATRWNGSTVTLNHGHSYVLQEEYSDRMGGCAYQ